MNLHLWFDADAGPELAHYGAALGQHLRQRGWAVTAEYPREWLLDAFLPAAAASDQSRVVAFGGNGPRDGLAVSLQGAQLEIVDGQNRATIPFAVTARTFPHRQAIESDLPRVLFHGEDPSGRRLRMTSRVLAEMRRRRFAFVAISCGSLNSDIPRGAGPDEVHHSLLPDEFAELFVSATCVLETSDQGEMLSSASVVGCGLGIPTVCHRDVAVALNSGLAVDEWSADAFAEAVMAVDPKTQITPDQRRWAESLDQFEKVLRVPA